MDRTVFPSRTLSGSSDHSIKYHTKPEVQMTSENELPANKKPLRDAVAAIKIDVLNLKRRRKEPRIAQFVLP